MPAMLPTISELATRALHTAFGVDADPVVRETSDPRFGDYQVNGVLPLAKKLRENPRALAAKFVEAFEHGGMFQEPEIAGPGFINLRLNPAWVAAEVGRRVADVNRLGVEPIENAQSVVIDFSSPNVAKTMHVGHLRSTIIGDSLTRTLRFLGHNVVGDNHVGDWGTQFGTLIWAWRRSDHSDEAELSIGDLETLYKAGTAASKEDPAIAEACRAELAKLQSGDAENMKLWERFVAISRREAEDTYDRLGVEFDTWHGESSYSDALPGVITDLVDSGLAQLSDGAMVVFFEENTGLGDNPFLIQKSDGAFLYSTTDIATIRYRKEVHNAERMIYVVDVRQSLHFKQLFKTAELMGIEATFEHVGFGMMLGADGRPFRTRDGGTVTLASLLDEAEERILPIVVEKWPESAETDQRDIAAKVGIGAVKYADLCQNLTTDYKFEWDKLLAADGNTGPYLQYTLVRIRSVLKQYEKRTGNAFVPNDSPLTLESPEEIALALELLKFHDALDRVSQTLRPHVLCEYLYGLSRKYNPFYGACPILKAEGEVLHSRLSLCAAAARTLEVGLSCLNLPMLERM
jgi:arginyl-tRNA synthetase